VAIHTVQCEGEVELGEGSIFTQSVLFVVDITVQIISYFFLIYKFTINMAYRVMPT
jgi:hypothetical protein